MITDARQAEKLCQIYEKEGIECSVIGKVVSREKGVKIVEGKEELSLSQSNQDELNRVL